MRKRRILMAICLLLLLCLGLFLWYRHSLLNRVADLQPLMIMVDGTRYVCYGNTEEKPPDAPSDGVITKVNSKTDYPDADGEANFGTMGMPYWRIGSKILVESNQSYYILSKLGNQE